jgi:hypothetical protein
MFTAQRFALAGAIAALAVSLAPAQTIISARSGLVHQVEGEAWMDDQAIEPRAGEFPEIKEKSVFRTGEGRAEILLNSGVFLRVAENGSVRMISNRLIDTRIELLAGEALVEAAEILPDNSVTIVAGEAQALIGKKGLYAFDANPSRLRVFDGVATVEVAGQSVVVHEGRTMLLDGKTLTTEKFDNKVGDPLYRWSKRRAEYVAMANASAAHSLQQSGSSWMSSGWRYNQWYNMFTFVPASGMFYSPFGYSYYSPQMVYYVYAPRPVYGGGYGGGYTGGNRGIGFDSSGGYVTAPRGMGSVVSSPSTSATSAGSAPAGGMRGGGGAPSGGSAGGGRAH